MTAYRITWTEQNMNGTTTTESIGVDAHDADDAIAQVNAVANVVEVLKVERV